ncbi:MAG: DNA polymerase IV [Thalassobius sp.]|nr:DNA polymerase IV [Thalassovita sp.]
MHRKIIHIDMDAFFASVEQRDFPEYRGKPLAVGGSKERGVVAAASYEAREYGVRSAMPSSVAYRKCPHIIFVKSRFDVYKEVSKQIREIFFEYTDLVEPLSLDEAYLDVSENKKGIPSATLIAKEIKAAIKEKTGLTASAGISFNKFLAKVASDMDKPNGLYLVHPDKAEEFIEKLPIEKFHGIGKVTAEKMKNMGIHNGLDLKQREEFELIKSFGKAGRYFYKIARAIDERPVKPHRIRKSLGAERTYFQDISDEKEMLEAVHQVCEKVFERMQGGKVKGKTLTLKIKTFDFQINTRSTTQNNYFESLEELKMVASKLLYQPEFPDKPVRLLGVALSNLQNPEEVKHGVQLKINFEEE